VIQLDDYQRDAVNELLARSEFGLFDEAGVGKSHPTIHAALQYPGSRLFTMPAYLIPQFAGMIKQYDPNLTIATTLLDGKAAKTAALESSADFVLASYNTWSTFDGAKPRYPQLHNRRWGACAFDESHRMRGMNSLWTKQVFKLRNADSKNRDTPVWWLTGTPLVAGPKDVWTFLHMCNRKAYPGFWDWAEHWCYVTDTPWERQVGKLRAGRSEEFRAMMRDYSMRRLCEQIPQLAGLEMVFKDVTVTLPASVYRMLKELQSNYRLRHEDLPEDVVFEHAGAIHAQMRLLTALPPTTAQPKLDAFRGYLEDHSAERIVVFAWHREVVEAAMRVVQKLSPKRPLYRFSGDSSVREKVTAQEGYAEHSNAVVVGTIAAMNAGVNLQAGHHCAFLEESYLPGENEQAVRRLLRRGQKRPVVVTRIRAADSVDNTVWRIAHKRGEAIRAAMGE